MTPFTDRMFAEALPDAILILNDEHHVIWWNQIAEKLFHLSSSQQPLPATRLMDTKEFQHFLTQPTQTTLEIVAPYQSNMTWSLTMVPYQANHRLLIGKDITHLHHLEKMRQAFVANVSHELRTPLTVTHGYIETLLEHHLPETQIFQPIFIQMQQQTLRMESLVEDLLLLSRLETDLPEAKKQQQVSIDTLLETICRDARALSADRAHDIQLTRDTSVDLYGCIDELRSAFSNLIFNAVNYTPARGTIHVNWSLQDDAVVLTVEDSGIGIAAEHIPRLTERFYRVDKSRSREAGGSGLGLAIVKHVLLRHDAYLTINSQPGKGSRFQCRFPKQRVVIR